MLYVRWHDRFYLLFIEMEIFSVVSYILVWFLLWIISCSIFIYSIQRQFDQMKDLAYEWTKQAKICIKERKICLDQLERAYTKIEKYEHINEKI